MEACLVCKNLNVVHDKEMDYKWCRNCGWTSDGQPPPRLVDSKTLSTTKAKSSWYKGT